MIKDIQPPPKRYDIAKAAIRKSDKRFHVGLDTGTKTGFAVLDRSVDKLLKIETLKIHEAMRRIEGLICNYGIENIHVRFEDARLRKWYGNAGREKLQGAGSIKRDGVIWQDYLTDLKISFEAVAPMNNTTKLNETIFRKITGCTTRTSEHSRDAAMLIWGR